ncbi:MAG: ComEA family DNA-binding protein [Acidobacteria bacterium]|nr:ComEA family DNA-binding protein [Acidobacteriota bacterium]
MSPPGPNDPDPSRHARGSARDAADLRGSQEAALDQLVRRAGGAGSARSSGGPTGFRWPPDRRVVAVVVVVVLLASAPWWWQLRRPRPAEQTLPRADVTTTPAPSSTGVPGSGGTGADHSATGGAGAASPVDGDSGTGPGDGGELVVHVVGGVLRPGVLRLPAGARAVDAVELAGGLVPLADSARVNLAAELVDGQRLVVPIVGQEPPSEVLSAPGAARPAPGAATGSSSGPSSGPSVPLDVNVASAEELDGLPGIGPSTAAAIVDHRDTTGPFRSVDGLLDVRGIGDAKLEAIRDLVTVG